MGAYVWKGYKPIYPEHDDAYLAECAVLLKSKGAKLEKSDELAEMMFKLSVRCPDAVLAAERKYECRYEV